jgi:hypothetical protein
VIVNPAVANLTKEQVSDLFLGEVKVFKPLDLPSSAPAKAEFYQKVSGHDPSQVKATWSRLLFTGPGPAVQGVPRCCGCQKSRGCRSEGRGAHREVRRGRLGEGHSRVAVMDDKGVHGEGIPCQNGRHFFSGHLRRYAGRFGTRHVRLRSTVRVLLASSTQGRVTWSKEHEIVARTQTGAPPN